MIQRNDLLAMVRHWLETPVNGYFGSGYGADLNALLLRPMSEPIADEFIDKMRRDIPVLNELSSDQLAILTEDDGFERKNLYLRIDTHTINLSDVVANMRGAFNVDAG